jgi:hypothetical protein
MSPGGDQRSGLQPTLRIPAEPLGYRPPGRLYLLARYNSSSLDFLDPTHLLLTFRAPRLLVRREGSDGMDQVVHADVVELPTGKVVAEDEWLLHDRARYVWRLADNKVLLRIGPHLYEADNQLHLKELYESPTDLEAVETSPDGRLLVMETELEKHTPEEHDRLDQPKLMLTARAEAAADLPASLEGFFTQEEVQGGVWNVRFHRYDKPQSTDGEIVTQTSSTCEPMEKVLNEQSVLVLSCPRGHNDRFVAAYSLNSRKLWDGRWKSNFTWPSFRVAQDGGSVAISWIAVNHPVSAQEQIDDQDVQNQVVSVLDSRTGNLRLALLIKPIVSAGGNFALSADGKRLAVLNRGSLEVYDIPSPPSPHAERAAK